MSKKTDKDIKKITEGAIIPDGPKYKKLYVKQRDLHRLWDEMNELFPYNFSRSGASWSFSNLKEAQELLGDIFLLTVPEWNNLSMWQFQAKWSDTKQRKDCPYKDYFKGLGGVTENELIIAIYTEEWNLVTDFTFEKKFLLIDCIECGVDGTSEDGHIEHNDEVYCKRCAKNL